MDISDGTYKLIQSADLRVRKFSNYDFNDIKQYVYNLLTFGEIEVGWRESCGTTDRTMKIYREWLKVLKSLKKDGLNITEERIKHDNSYATSKGGFWNSIKYTYTK
jgi:hypothetical protein